MSRDSWERLVTAVVRRQQIWELCHADSRSPSISSISSDDEDGTSSRRLSFESSDLKSFELNDLREATRNFRPESVLGEGGFGCVFKGWIDERTFKATKPGTGAVIAIKRLNQKVPESHSEWLTRINFLGQLYHPNLVKLIGYCLEDDRRFLVYEFMSRGSLDDHLYRRMVHLQPLHWNLRMKIALGAAKGLAYLHSAEAKVVYRDFKSSNILLDGNYNAKLSDFGLATRAMGSFGYAAPEYMGIGHVTARSDVYSFGVVLLQILTGRRVLDKNLPRGGQKLVEWAGPFLASKRKVLGVIDARIKGQYSPRAALEAATLASKCIALEPKYRPTMPEVVKALEQLQETSILT
ncbi:hypothetical protein ABFS83_06G077000 [Erythranthe nasuta]